MGVELGRIEAEFIFSKLRDYRPTLHIQHQTDCIHLKKNEYTCNKKNIVSRFGNEIHYVFENLRILFQYNNTSYFFISTATIDTGVITIPFPSSLFREDRVVDSPSTSKLTIGQKIIEITSFFEIENGYLDSLVETGVLEEKIKRIAEKFQIPETHSLLVVQVYSFLEKLKEFHSALQTSQVAHCIAFDHEYALFSFNKKIIDQESLLKFCSIDFIFKNRNIRIQGEILCTSVFLEDIAVCTIRYVTIYREDIRFLFERLYKTQFEG